MRALFDFYLRGIDGKIYILGILVSGIVRNISALSLSTK
jgi:hypothetical protein